MPSVAIIVLTWNNYHDTRECLESLSKINYPSFKIIVVDNHSTDNSIAKLKSEFGQCDFITNAANYGYAGGNNIGILYALHKGYSYVWIINNDAVVEENSLLEMVKVAESNPRVGIVGSKVYFYDDPVKLWFAGGKVNKLTGITKHIGIGEKDLGQYNMKKNVDYITGCNLLIKKSCLNDIGLFDENYFLYYEDTDLSIRAKKKGWSIVFIPITGVWHKIESGRKSLSKSLLENYYFTRNKLYFIKKNYPFSLPIAIIVSLKSHIIDHLIERKWDHLKVSILGYKDFFLKCMGNKRHLQ